MAVCTLTVVQYSTVLGNNSFDNCRTNTITTMLTHTHKLILPKIIKTKQNKANHFQIFYEFRKQKHIDSYTWNSAFLAEYYARALINKYMDAWKHVEPHLQSSNITKEIRRT